MKPIIFFDGECALCDASVRLLLRIDRARLFLFAPLQGATASEKLHPPPERDSLVLLEDDGRRSLEGGAVLRILWLLGGAWTLLGWMHFLPSLPFDLVYRLIARHRHRLFGSDPFCAIPEEVERFLP